MSAGVFALSEVPHALPTAVIPGIHEQQRMDGKGIHVWRDTWMPLPRIALRRSPGMTDQSLGGGLFGQVRQTAEKSFEDFPRFEWELRQRLEAIRAWGAPLTISGSNRVAADKGQFCQSVIRNSVLTEIAHLLRKTEEEEEEISLWFSEVRMGTLKRTANRCHSRHP